MLAEINKESNSTGTLARRVLLADLDPDSIEILKILLTLEGHEVEAAFSGKRALEIAGKFKPEVVLLYTGLPDIETARVVENLRWAIPEVTLVALVDWREKDETPLHWEEAGFDHHLLKPVSAEDVITLLKP